MYPHPVNGVIDILKENKIKFKKIILKNCGHNSFLETNDNEFYEVLNQILK